MTGPDQQETPATDPHPPASSALRCLIIVASSHQLKVDVDWLFHEYGTRTLGPEEVVLAAKKIGLRAKMASLNLRRAERIPFPCMLISKDGDYSLLGAVRQNDEGKTELLVITPGADPPKEVLVPDQVRSRFRDRIIYLAPADPGASVYGKFGFGWFLPSFLEHRAQFLEVFAGSLLITLLGLALPLFFQIVVDKVLAHRALGTLNVLAFGVLSVFIVSFALDMLRTYLLVHTASRIDVKLGSHLWGHLLRIPVTFFEVRPVGTITARITELDTIRGFFTGAMSSTVLDALFATVILAVMAYYSPFLTGIVGISLAVYAVLTVIVTPILRRQIRRQFECGAVNQAFLVEILSNMSTIKAHATESQMLDRWGRQLASYVTASFRASLTGASASKLVVLISSITTVAIVWNGAHAVMAGLMTIGELIAFNMFAARVAAPVIRLAQLWQDYQQVNVAIERLTDILGTPVEDPSTLTSDLPRIRGEIEFKGVSFHYPTRKTPALQDIDLRIGAGQRVGIVGESGSGKSTLAKLMLKFHNPDGGRIFVDGFDLSTAHPNWVRRQSGIVLQDTRLLNLDIWQNIALSQPDIPKEQIIESARMAGAHDFISELEKGYDTLIEEGGQNLSGGQRQRIAIARSLARDARILILDEATSALDYESERIIQRNMRRIAEGRTVIIISHRLSVVRDCDLIVAMRAGRIVESGSHDELLGIPDGLYARMFRLQDPNYRE